LQPTIKGVEADIANVRRTIKKYENRSKDLKGELEKLASSIQALINDSALDVEAARNLTHEFHAQQINIQRFTRETSSLEHIIAQRRKELDAILAKLKEL